MAQVSSAVTGGVTLSVTTLEPIVTWALTGFKGPPPPMLAGAIATVVLTGGHFLVNRFLNLKGAS